MPSDSFRVVPASFQEVGSRVGELQQRLAEVVAQLDGALASSGGMAGRDQPGDAFVSAYDPAAGQLTGLMSQCLTGLGSVAAALQVTGENYLRADAAATVRITPR